APREGIGLERGGPGAAHRGPSRHPLRRPGGIPDQPRAVPADPGRPDVPLQLHPLEGGGRQAGGGDLRPLRRPDGGRARDPPREREVVVKYRGDGVLYNAMEPIDKRFHSSIISRIKVMSELDIAEKRIPQDGRFKLKIKGRAIDFRVSIMPSVHGEDAVIRILDKESVNEEFAELRLDVLGFTAEDLRRLRKFIREPYGMVLVTGPSGPGKT